MYFTNCNRSNYICIWHTIDHKEKDGSSCILPEYFAGIKRKRLKKMPRKTPIDIKLFKVKTSFLSYACPSTDVNWLFETISDGNADSQSR